MTHSEVVSTSASSTQNPKVKWCSLTLSVGLRPLCEARPCPRGTALQAGQQAGSRGAHGAPLPSQRRRLFQLANFACAERSDSETKAKNPPSLISETHF